MGQRLGGFGGNLPAPQYLYPSELTYAAIDQGNNRFGLAAGDCLVIPPGDWALGRGPYTFLQEYDPVNNAWWGFSTARVGRENIHSDGVNFRLANLTGCPVAGVVVAGGSGYVQGSTTCTASAGGSTWQPIVGGMLSVTTISVAGSGYGIAPLVLIPAPPAPGVQATAHAAITGGSVTTVTLDNVGAGYITAPTITIVPHPFDPNLATAVPVTATALCAIVGAGSITAVICTNNGAPASPSLTIAGVGSSASVAVVSCNTMTAGSVAAGGTGFSGGGGLTTVGGIPTAAPLYTNPAVQLVGEIPRPAAAGFFATGGSLVSISTIYDGGLFYNTGGAPVVLVTAGAGNLQLTTASVTITMGSTTDTSYLQPI